MLGKLTTVNVWVNDQDEALEFYTEKLGMEIRDDVTVPEMGNFRWLTVGPPGQSEVASAADRPGPAVFDEETSELTRSWQGRRRRAVLLHRRLPRHYEELKAKGVEFTQEPTEQPYGIDAGFRDPSGN